MSSLIRDRIQVYGRQDRHPTLQRGTDEWCNKSLYVGIPFLLAFAVFYGRRPVDRSGWWLSGTTGIEEDGPWKAHYISPDSQSVATVLLDHDPFYDDCPHTRSAEWILTHVSTIECLEDEDGEREDA